MALLLPVALSAFLACNGEIAGSDVPAADAGVDAGRDGCAAWADAVLAYAVRCGDDVVVTDRERHDFVQECERMVAAPGEVDLEASFERCAAGIARGSCKDLFFAGCEDTRGTLGSGAPCGAGFQCATGYCKKVIASESVDEPACGTCADAIPPGEPCTSDRACGPGSYCAGVGGEGRCTAYRRADAGAACDRGDPEPCLVGLVCNTDVSGTATCQPRAKAGAPCADDLVCDGDLVCHQRQRTCVPRVAEGGSCSDVECDHGLSCDPATKTCTKTIRVPLGEVCDRDVRFCTEGYCQGATDDRPGTCAPFLPVGSACDRSDPGSCGDAASCRNGVCTVDDPSTCR